MLTQARLKEVLHYETTTGVFTSLQKRSNTKIGDVVGCKNSDGYLVASIDGKLHYMHRLAIVYVLGNLDENQQVDHRNQNRSDNSLDNLRVVSHRENSMNHTLRSTNKSGFVGVSWDKARQKWIASITINGKAINLGGFTTIEEAAEKRLEASKDAGFYINHGKEKVK